MPKPSTIQKFTQLPKISMKKLMSASPAKEFSLGFRLAYLYIKRGRKWTMSLTIFLMAIAFVNLIFMSSLLSGIVSGTERQVRDNSSGEIYLAPELGHKYIDNPTAILDRLKSVSDLTAAAPILSIYGELEDHEYSTAGQIRVMNSDDKILKIHEHLIDGDYISDADEEGIILGYELVAPASERQILNSLEKIHVGDTVHLKFGGLDFPLKVRGIFKTKYIEADRTALMSRHTWEAISKKLSENPLLSGLVPSKDGVNLVILRTDPTKIDSTIKAIDDLNLSNVSAHPWKDAAGFMVSVSSSFLGIDAIMLAVGIVIAGVTIFIVIYVDVVNKRRQIGIQRAIGVKPRIIVFSYVLLSIFYAIFGIAIGLIIFYGVLVPYFAAYPLSLPVTDASLDLSYAQFTLRTMIVMVVSVVSGLIPAIMATRTKMLDAILGRG